MNLSKLIPVGKRSQAFLGFGRSKQYEEIRAGRLAAVQIGARTFLTEDEIARYRAEHERKLARPAVSAPVKAA